MNNLTELTHGLIDLNSKIDEIQNRSDNIEIQFSDLHIFYRFSMVNSVTIKKVLNDLMINSVNIQSYLAIRDKIIEMLKAYIKFYLNNASTLKEINYGGLIDSELFYLSLQINQFEKEIAPLSKKMRLLNGSIESSAYRDTVPITDELVQEYNILKKEYKDLLLPYHRLQHEKHDKSFELRKKFLQIDFKKINDSFKNVVNNFLHVQVEDEQEYLDFELVRNIHSKFKDVLFKDIKVGELYKLLNLKELDPEYNIPKDGKFKYYYFIHHIDKLTKSKSSGEWLNHFLDKYKHVIVGYHNNYRRVVGDDASINQLKFADSVNEFFEDLLIEPT